MTVHDARAVANFFLDYAQELNVPISNLSLQKILYFAHGWHHVHFNAPLIKNTFEAWPYGPVVRCVYDNFKRFGDQPIKDRAYSFDAIKNQKIVCKYNFISRQRAYLEGIFQEYGSLRFYTLVDLSHTVGSPWDLIRNKSKSEEPVGLLIPESLIESYFKSISGKNVSVN